MILITCTSGFAGRPLRALLAAAGRAARAAFSTEGPTALHNNYVICKLEMEVGLRAIATATRLEAMIVPPLVYGSGVKANLACPMATLLRGLRRTVVKGSAP